MKKPLGLPGVQGGMVDWSSQSGWATSLLCDLGELIYPLWSFLICLQQVFKDLSGYDFRTIATCLSGSQFGSHWVGSREVP